MKITVNELLPLLEQHKHYMINELCGIGIMELNTNEWFVTISNYDRTETEFSRAQPYSCFYDAYVAAKKLDDGSLPVVQQY